MRQSKPRAIPWRTRPPSASATRRRHHSGERRSPFHRWGATHLATEAAMAARINVRRPASVVVELKISGPVNATPNRLRCLHTTSQLRCLRSLKTTRTNLSGRFAGSPSSSKAPDDERLRIMHLTPSPGPTLILPAFNVRSRPAPLRSPIASTSRLNCGNPSYATNAWVDVSANTKQRFVAQLAIGDRPSAQHKP
jgi:hypothetical protein